jgi:predicted transcriptional regulator
MVRAGKKIRKPRLYMVPLRALFFSFLVTLVAFAVALLLGIVGVIAYARMHGIPPDLRFAYRDIAAPFAAVVGLLVLVLTLGMEITHYRQSKALASIERHS